MYFEDSIFDPSKGVRFSVTDLTPNEYDKIKAKKKKAKRN